MTCNTCNKPKPYFAQSTMNPNISQHADYMLFRETGVFDPNDSIYDGTYRGVSIDLNDPFTKAYPKQVKQLVDLGISVKDKQTQITAIWNNVDLLKKYTENKFADQSAKLVSLGNSVTDKQKQIDNIWSKVSSISTSAGGKKSCEWYDIPCHIGNFTSGVGTIALFAVGGYLIYKLVLKRVDKIAICGIL